MKLGDGKRGARIGGRWWDGEVGNGRDAVTREARVLILPAQSPGDPRGAKEREFQYGHAGV